MDIWSQKNICHDLDVEGTVDGVSNSQAMAGMQGQGLHIGHEELHDSRRRIYPVVVWVLLVGGRD